MATQRFWINTTGPDFDALREGMRWLNATATAGHRGLVAVVAKDTLGGVITDALGENVTKALAKGLEIRLPSGGSMRLMTGKSIPHAWCGDVILAIHAPPSLLDVIDGLPGVAAVLVIPWIASDVELWRKVWNPTELGAPAAGTVAVPPPAAPTVSSFDRAMEALSKRVNVSTGITHPSDKQTAIALLLALRETGAPFSSDEVRISLRQREWDPKDANSVGELADRILSGARIRCNDMSTLEWARRVVT